MPTILHTEASRGFGGQELRILAETRWLLDHGWDALLACQPASPLHAEAEAAGIPAVAVRMRGAHDLPALFVLRRLMKARAVSLIHTHSSVDSWLGALAARSLRRPVVRSRHVSIRIRSPLALVYRLADRVVTSGEAVRAIVVGAGLPAGRVVSIPPGVDTRRFHPGVSGKTVRDEHRLSAAQPRVGTDGKLRASQGQQACLVDARERATRRPAPRLLVPGRRGG